MSSDCFDVCFCVSTTAIFTVFFSAGIAMMIGGGLMLEQGRAGMGSITLVTFGIGWTIMTLCMWLFFSVDTQDCAACARCCFPWRRRRRRQSRSRTPASVPDSRPIVHRVSVEVTIHDSRHVPAVFSDTAFADTRRHTRRLAEVEQIRFLPAYRVYRLTRIADGGLVALLQSSSDIGDAEDGLASLPIQTHAECIICLDQLAEGTHVIRLPCHHYNFHAHCCTEWFKHQQVCPFCRLAC